MDVGQAEIFGELAVSDSEVHGIGQAVTDSIVDTVVGFLITVKSRRNNCDENDEKNREELNNVAREPAETREKRFVVELFEFVAKN